MYCRYKKRKNSNSTFASQSSIVRDAEKDSRLKEKRNHSLKVADERKVLKEQRIQEKVEKRSQSKTERESIKKKRTEERI